MPVGNFQWAYAGLTFRIRQEAVGGGGPMDKPGPSGMVPAFGALTGRYLVGAGPVDLFLYPQNRAA